eukprot:6190924-Pleurochrysis_carterae.AAC.1
MHTNEHVRARGCDGTPHHLQTALYAHLPLTVYERHQRRFTSSRAHAHRHECTRQGMQAAAFSMRRCTLPWSRVLQGDARRTSRCSDLNGPTFAHVTLDKSMQ